MENKTINFTQEIFDFQKNWYAKTGTPLKEVMLSNPTEGYFSGSVGVCHISLKAYNPNMVGVNFTITKKNLDIVPTMISFSEKLKLDFVNFRRFIPVGAGKENNDLELTPQDKIPYDYFTLLIAENLSDAGDNKTSEQVLDNVALQFEEELDYFLSLDKKVVKSMGNEVSQPLYIYREIALLLQKMGLSEKSKIITDKFQDYYGIYSGMMSR